MITKLQIALKLKDFLQAPYNPDKIAAWAEDIYFNHRQELSMEVSDIIGTLAIMSEGEGEFVYPEDDLRKVIKMLLNNVEDPFEKIQDFHKKQTEVYVKFTNEQLGQALKNILNEFSDPLQIAVWAENMLVKHSAEISKHTYHVLEALIRMKQNSNFFYTAKELNILAEELIFDEEFPFEEITDLRNKERGRPSHYPSRWLVHLLRRQLRKPYDPQRIAAWAEKMYNSTRMFNSEKPREFLRILSKMALGKEFVYTRDELKIACERLWNNEENPFENIRRRQQ